MDLRNIFAITLLALLVGACSENKYEKYEGVWEGNFEGDREATLLIFIAENGEIRAGATVTDTTNQSFNLGGVISEDGDVTLDASVLGREMRFDGFATESNMTGTWILTPDSISGTWTATKREGSNAFPYFLIFNPNRQIPPRSI